MFQYVTDYDFKPSTWTLDLFIQVPDDANGRKTTRRTNEFVVQR